MKLEIHPDPQYLLPDPIETLRATEILAKEGFTVLPYINADPVLAKRLEDAGAATVMPLGSPIGSNRGLETRGQIAIIIEQAREVLIWGRLPNWTGLGIYTLVATAVAWAGYAWFQKTRKGFADVL